MNRLNALPTISPAQERDQDEIRQLARETWYLHYPRIITVKQIDYMLEQRYAPEEIQRLIASPHCNWLKIELEQAIQGFGHFDEDASAHSIKIDKLYVHHRAQGLGCGTSLIRYAETHYGRLGFKKISLQVNKGNLASIAFYLKLGYHKEKSVVFDIGQGLVMDDFIMSKTLY